MFEGAQGTLLDIDHGTYPFVTSSNPIAGAACVGAGVGPEGDRRRLGVAKAYTTRVGAGPFPTELDDEIGEQHPRARPRVRHHHRPPAPHAAGSTSSRCVTRRASTALTALVHHEARRALGVDPLRVCTSYRNDEGADFEDFPYHQTILHNAKPSTIEVPGWDEDIGGCRSIEDLPAAAQRYLEFIADFVGVPIKLIGVGPGREQVVWADGAQPLRAVA